MAVAGAGARRWWWGVAAACLGLQLLILVGEAAGYLVFHDRWFAAFLRGGGGASTAATADPRRAFGEAAWALATFGNTAMGLCLLSAAGAVVLSGGGSPASPRTWWASAVAACVTAALVRALVATYETLAAPGSGDGATGGDALRALAVASLGAVRGAYVLVYAMAATAAVGGFAARRFASLQDGDGRKDVKHA